MENVNLLVKLADFLDGKGLKSFADFVDTLIVRAYEEDENEIISDIKFHRTEKEEKLYHKFLKRPENWNNADMVSWIIRGKDVKDKVIHGMEWRNCLLCDGTLNLVVDKAEFEKEDY